ncbi:conserved hypothetical protein [Leishmania braziliensis MHOM/BR/75/M2904]|uniref:Uncharacterized protein n=2 Tax=Leishmania braziliensis TaxID=5660 RepID=A4HB12_LEIBR|nr:conserved hypothetical protein [Leishmania braziliensis MHOM/BR/75/M2904]CAJ2471478.1 unnamed protein product [Leishmania braziliensis]CAM38597.1 conserved hypothetical protein [Leishmania braziliensis MHOM/BR/75/M2904]SYZ65298.1 hypothetical_protein [Leishmania braziliensis MHOM/BR/75/M2904]
MFQRSYTWLFFNRIFKISKPPVTGYEIAELPNEKVLHDFMQHYRTKGVVVIVHSGAPYAAASAASSAETRSSPISVSLASSGMHSTTATVKPASTAKPNTKLLHDPLTRSFISSINAMNLGNPEEVKLALVPGPQAPCFVEEYNVITYPTSLLFLNGQCVHRVVGARTRELSIKSLFMLRNGGRNIFSRE